MTQGQPANTLRKLRSTLATLYHGQSRTALRFQFAVLLIDLAIIAFFIIAPVWRERPGFLWLDYAVATLLAADVTARALAASDIVKWLRQLTTLVDILILVTLLAPTLFANIGFLRVLRLWTLSRSGFLWRPLRKRGLQQWEDTGRAVVNLVTFIFAITGFVYLFFVGQWKGLAGYVDALYFTISSMTTTGYGDITLPGTGGKLASVVVMLLGISLLIRLAQALFRPAKVFHPCSHCGLKRHDPDAVHCKACGNLLNIPDEGHGR